MESTYHVPVLLNECLDALKIRPDGVYLDGTLGGGGHASQIFARLTTGRLMGIDRDPEAIRAATARLAAQPGVCDTPDQPGALHNATGAQFRAIRGNFHDADAILAAQGVARLDGALLDLGVSSHQLDERSRGFSYHGDAPLDMRMDTSQSLTARTIVNTYGEDEITRILRDYGEENWARQIARVLVDRRKRTPIETTAQLTAIVDAAIPKAVRAKDESHPARRTFQALRIAVNDELAPLARALTDIAARLAPGGRFAVIAFHSLEDRIVKETFRQLADPCTCPKQFPICVCGRKPIVRLVTRKPIVASEEERTDNPRARSATLRVVEGVAV